MAAVSEPRSTRAVEAGNGFLSRDDLLKAVSLRAEEIVDVPGLGKVLCGEIGGDVRAALIGKMASDAQGQRDYDRVAYEKRLLLGGILDPSSPPDARTPLLRSADADALMKLGAAKVQALVSAVERLSGMGPDAIQRAEGNSGPAGSGSPTSS